MPVVSSPRALYARWPGFSIVWSGAKCSALQHFPMILRSLVHAFLMSSPNVKLLRHGTMRPRAFVPRRPKVQVYFLQRWSSCIRFRAMNDSRERSSSRSQPIRLLTGCQRTAWKGIRSSSFYPKKRITVLPETIRAALEFSGFLRRGIRPAGRRFGECIPSDSGTPELQNYQTMQSYGIIHQLKRRWERVRPSGCQRSRDGASRVSAAGRKSSRSCEPKSRSVAQVPCNWTRRVLPESRGDGAVLRYQRRGYVSIRLSARLSGSRVVPREPGSRLCRMR